MSTVYVCYCLDDSSSDSDGTPEHKHKRAQSTMQTHHRRKKYAHIDFTLNCRQQLHYIMDSVPMTVVITTIVLLAIGIAMAQMFGVDSGNDVPSVYGLEIFCSVFFVVEVIMRLTAYGPKMYFGSPLCIIDILVTLLDVLSQILQVWFIQHIFSC